MSAVIVNKTKYTLNLYKRRLFKLFKINKFITRQFHKFYYGDPAWQNTTWFGTTTLKCPLDLWIYQELIYKLKPEVIVECGTSHGGSARYLASLFDLIGHGEIITIDIEPKPNRPVHPRIHYVNGSSTAPEIVTQVKAKLNGRKNVMVILDSDHSRDHVLGEIRAYHDLVPVGGYLIVEDTNINGHPVYKSFGPGPMEAVNDFLAENKNFVIDREQEKFYLTFNPRGYLKRIA